MSETVIYAIFFLGIFISGVIYVIRLLKTPNCFKTMFGAYLAFLERDTFPKPKKRKNVKVKKTNHWEFLFKEKMPTYEEFTEEFPNEEYPYH